MRRLTVVIPSKTLSNLEVCTAAIREHEPSAKIIVVDDGLEFNTADQEQFYSAALRIIPGESPFIFSRNCNIGIRAAGDDDIVLMNDDAILRTPCGLTAMQQAAETHPDFGIIASTTNNAGNVNQHPKGVGLRFDPRQVCFICVLIPRRTLNAVGFLDERFCQYGFEDDDYSLRVRKAGLKLGIHDACFVDHSTLPSTFRGNPKTPAKLDAGRQIFIDKWGGYPL